MPPPKKDKMYFLREMKTPIYHDIVEQQNVGKPSHALPFLSLSLRTSLLGIYMGPALCCMRWAFQIFCTWSLTCYQCSKDNMYVYQEHTETETII